MIHGAEFHHLGVACRSFEAEMEHFISMGYRQESPDIHDPVQKVFIRFLIGEGPRIELVRSDGTPGPLGAWLKSGSKLYHMAYLVDDVAAASSALCDQGAKVLIQPVEATAFSGRKITFIMLPNMLLIELIQNKHVAK